MYLAFSINLFICLLDFIFYFFIWFWVKCFMMMILFPVHETENESQEWTAIWDAIFHIPALLHNCQCMPFGTQPYLQSLPWDIDCSTPRCPNAWTNICRFHFRRQCAMSILSHLWSWLNGLLIWSSQFTAVFSTPLHSLLFSVQQVVVLYSE